MSGTVAAIAVAAHPHLSGISQIVTCSGPGLAAPGASEKGRNPWKNGPKTVFFNGFRMFFFF